ncbi:MAG TPA: metallophosphoesterase [Candidatus Sumerlaeota bacterium]|nr:metallophosphoesterase [Candidatus Sumerlaeota bacterium]HPK02198.1 metallophosphoesterase [Candidatus Sumerlaeota bacterium]
MWRFRLTRNDPTLAFRGGWRHWVRFAVLLAALGLATLALILAGEELWGPAWAEPARTWLYRVAFWIVLPVRGLVLPLAREVNHHWPARHYMLLGLALPLWFGVLGWIAHRLGQRARVKLGRGGEAASARTAVEPAPAATVAQPGRRRFLIGAALGVGGGAAAGAGVYGVWLLPSMLRVRHYDIPVPDLPAALDVLRVVHLSDTHYGPFISLSYLKEVIERINALRPDLVLLTGDYVHRTENSVEPGIAALAALRARLGVAAVLGNHDHWEGAPAVRRAFAAADIPLVDNDRLFLTVDGLAREPADPADALCVAGVGDLWEDEVEPEQALAGVPAATPRLLLSHNPDVAEHLNPRLRVDLMLCGHTHGGQVYLPLIGAPIIPSAYGQKYVGGMCRGPTCPVLVTRGVGMAFLPVRLGVPPEFGVLTLRRTGSAAART